MQNLSKIGLIVSLLVITVFISGCTNSDDECIDAFFSESFEYRNACFREACSEFNLTTSGSFNVKDMEVRCNSNTGFGIDVAFYNTDSESCEKLMDIYIKYIECLR